MVPASGIQPTGEKRLGNNLRRSLDFPRFGGHGVMVRAGVEDDLNTTGFREDGVDADGLYPVARGLRLGAWRWSAPLVRLRAAPRRGRITLDLASAAWGPAEPATVTVRAPWGEHLVVPRRGRWTRVQLDVPDASRPAPSRSSSRSRDAGGPPTRGSLTTGTSA
jgi:hypothetical protein